MKNQSTKTHVRTSKEISTIQADPGTPIKPKCLIPRKNKTKRQHNQLTGNHRVYEPTSTQPKWKKHLKELKK